MNKNRMWVKTSASARDSILHIRSVSGEWYINSILWLNEIMTMAVVTMITVRL